MNAKTARQISDKASVKLFKQELKTILRYIKSSAKRGQSSVTAYNVKEDIQKELEALGFKVSKGSIVRDDDGDYSIQFEISWGEND